MDSQEKFTRAISYGLERVGKADIRMKDHQSKAVRYVYDKHDVFIWLPTGYGKSLCYEILPYVFDSKLGTDSSVVLVISPLVSLMIDQVQSLKARGVPAAILSGNTSGAYQGCSNLLAKDSELSDGRYKLLFGAPEAILGGARWREMLQEEPYSTHVVAVAVDEAHCVSKWYRDYHIVLKVIVMILLGAVHSDQSMGEYMNCVHLFHQVHLFLR